MLTFFATIVDHIRISLKHFIMPCHNLFESYKLTNPSVNKMFIEKDGNQANQNVNYIANKGHAFPFWVIWADF